MKSLSGYSSRENWTNETVACCHSSISVLYGTEFLNNIFHFNPSKSLKNIPVYRILPENNFASQFLVLL